MRPVLLAAALLLGSAAAALADDVALETGEVLRGTVVERGATVLVMEHPVLGTLRIPAGKVKFVVTEADRVAAEASARRVLPAEPAAPPPPGEGPAAPGEADWKSKFEAGVNGTGGNSRAQNFLVGARTEYTLPRDVWRFDARYTRSETEGVTSQSRLTAGGRKEWVLEDDRWRYFADGRYDRDQFTEWDQRGTLAAGASYRWLTGKSLSASLRAGAAGTKEWGSGEDHVRPEGLLGVEGKWKVDAAKEVVFESTVYPDLADTPEFRLASSLALGIRLDDGGSMNLRLGVDHEYDTHRKAPFKRTDYRYFAMLVVDF